jgi:hypothetical protein
MKLPPQLASLLPVPPKEEVVLRRDTDVFAATMQPLMAILAGGALAHTAQGSLNEHPWSYNDIPGRQEAHSLNGEEISEAEGVQSALPVFSKAIMASSSLDEGIGHVISHQSDVPISSPPTAENATGRTEIPKEKPQAVMVEATARAGLDPERGDILAMRERSGPEQKRHTERQPKAEQAAGNTVDTASTISVCVPVVLPNLTPHAETPEREFAKANSQIAIYAPRSLGGEGRKFSGLQPAAGLQPAMTASATEADLKGFQKIAQKKAWSDESTDRATFHDTALAQGRTVADTPLRSSPHSPDIAEHRKRIVLPSVPQADFHGSRETASGVTAITKVAVVEKTPVQSVLPGTMVVHQPTSSSVSPAITSQRVEIAAGAQHTETSVMQVLQRMDAAAPADIIQLRADARHLNVGVSSDSLGWVEVKATAGPSGTVDAALHVETNASAHVLAAQSKEITEYVRDHSVQLGQLSVGVETGDGMGGNARSAQENARAENAVSLKSPMKERSGTEPDLPPEKVSFISIRA